MVNLSLTDLLEYTDWERQKRYEWMRQQGNQVLKVSAGPNGDRIGTAGDLVKHIFSAEKRYVERLSGRPMTDASSTPNDNIEALFQFGKESRKSLMEFVETFPEEKWDVPQEQNLVVAVIVVTPRKSITHVLRGTGPRLARCCAWPGTRATFTTFFFAPRWAGSSGASRGPRQRDEPAMLDQPDRTKARNKIITIAFLTLLVVLSGGYDFWRGYSYGHSLYEGLLFAMLGFIVLGVIFILFSDRTGR